MSELKKCSKCGIELLLTDFNKRDGSKDGLRGSCKECRARYAKQYHKDNRETIAKQAKQYQQDNAEALAEQRKQYRQSNTEVIAEKRKKYDLKNKKQINEKQRARYQGNRDYYAQRCLRWARDNPEKTRIIAQRRRSQKRALPATLTVEQWKSIKEHFSNSCAYCGKELPLTQEHFLALSKGGEYGTANIIPSCQSCNSFKGAKDFFDWYPKFKHCSKKREKAILNYLGYKNNAQQLSIL